MVSERYPGWLNTNGVHKRKRLICLFALCIVIPLGLATRKFPQYFPSFVAEYGGDTFYAVMIYLLVSFAWPGKPVWFSFISALLFCYCIEVLQLYNADWFENIRNTRLGGLVLGYGFLWSDVLCYTLGVVLCLIIDLILQKIYPLSNEK